MLKRNRSNFFVGLLIGSLLVLLFWYYQKSTSAEDGALALLDRLAEAQNRLRRAGQQPGLDVTEAIKVGPTSDVGIEAAVSAPVDEPMPAALTADLQQVQGVGPVFARRLHQAGVHTAVTLAGLSAGRLAEILDINEGRADNILAATNELLASL